jgi:hypothetical protein
MFVDWRFLLREVISSCFIAVFIAILRDATPKAVCASVYF